MTITTKATAKVAAVAAGLAMATSMLSLAPLAHAATACSVGTADLTVGSTGDAVKCLQDTLIAGGYLTMPTGVMTGYFGSLTKTAVMQWQTAVKVSPAAGYFGSISRAAFTGVASTGGTMVPGCTSTTGYSTTTGMSCAATTTTLPAGCTSAVGFSPTTGVSCSTGTPTTPAGPLMGTDGVISDVDELGSYSNEEVGEGQDDVEVLGADIEASNDGDVALKSVKVSFDSTGNTGSDNLDDYITGVSIWLDGDKIGTADVDDFNEDGAVYSKAITVAGNTAIKADDTAKLLIAVDAANTFDSGDISGDSWFVDVDNIRFVDGSGVYTTDSSTGDIDGMNVDIDFVSFSSSADTELKVKTATDSPEEGIVVVDDSSETEDVSLLKGELELEGTSDAVLDELPISFTLAANGTGATANGVDDVVSSVTLKIGDEEYTETMTLTSALVGTITFDNLDFAIDAGDTVDFEVLADINDADGTVFVSGMVLKADVTSTNRDYIDIENEEGDQLADSTEKSGTTIGEYQELRTNGIGLTLVSTSAVATAGTSANDDVGTFTIKFKVTAIGDTMYVSSVADDTLTGVTAGKTSVQVDRAGTATDSGISAALTNDTDDDVNAAGLYEISEGESHTMTLTTSVTVPTAGTTGLFRAKLGGVSWSTSATDSTPNNAYTSSLDSFKTAYLTLN